MLRTLAIASISLALAGACGRPGPSPSISTMWGRLGVPVVDGKPDLSHVEISLDRIGDGDEGSSYGVILRGNDDGLWKGRAYVRVMGEQPIYFEQARLVSVLEKCDRLGLVTGDHACTLAHGSGPLTRITLAVGGKHREAISQLGEMSLLVRNSAEARWHVLMEETAAEIDEIAGSEGRIGSLLERRRNPQPPPTSK